MDCPKCKIAMEEFKAEGVTFDFCFDGCKGIWCDEGELAEFVETVEDLPDSSGSQSKSPLDCPKCQCSMQTRPYHKSETMIDVCPQCKGIWLDFKELGAVQKEAVKIDSKGRLSRVFQELSAKGYKVGIADVGHKK